MPEQSEPPRPCADPRSSAGGPSRDSSAPRAQDAAAGAPPMPGGGAGAADTLRILREDPDSAVTRLRDRIRAGEGDYRTWHNLAVALNNAGELDEAVEAVTRAIAMSERSAISHLLHGLLLREADCHEKALAALEEVARLDPQFPQLHANRGVVRFFLGDSEGAIADLERAVELEPRDATAHFNLAVVQIARKRFSEAQRSFQNLFALEPERAAHYQQFLVELGRVQMVEETLSQAHRLKNFLGIVGDRLRRFAEQVEGSLDAEQRDELVGIRDDQEKIYSDMVVFLGAIRPRPLRLDEVDLQRLIERIIFVATTNGQSVQVRCAVAGGPIAVSCDVDFFQEALLNLLLNAIDACQMRYGRGCPGGEVEIAAQPCPSPVDGAEEKGVVIAVRDNGVGIAEGDRERVFQFGFTTKTLGSGIGLAHTRRIVEEHGGAIELESTLGEGTEVRCILPRRARVSENVVNLSLRSQLLLEPHTLIIEEPGADLGI